MGQGTITGGGEKGLYTITQDFGTVRRDSIVAAYTGRMASLEAQLPGLEEKVAETEPEIEAARAAEDAAIQFYIAAILVEAPPQIMDQAKDALTKARRRVLNAEAAKLAAQTPVEGVKADIKALQLQVDSLMAGTIQKTQSAWCVDLTEDAPAGPVATIEVPGEPAKVLLCPGCRQANPSDGALLARHVMTPSQAFFNAAILPGWQKFKPTYRIGTVTAVNSGDETVDLTLDEATSSAAGLNVNQTSALSAVPVTYMTCNTGAFEEGDRVVVQFEGQDWSSPRVIGFESNPKPCLWPCIYAHGFYYYHVFECVDADLLAEIAVTSGISLDYRFNRGAWESMQWIQTISASGGRLFQQWGDPSPGIFDRPIVEIGYNVPLSVGYVEGGPTANGLAFYPANTFRDGPPTIVELRITKGGEVKMNCAFRWDPSNSSPTFTEVKAQGGIFPRDPGIEIRPLTGYDLFIKTGD
jgi:hypothetical protein